MQLRNVVCSLLILSALIVSACSCTNRESEHPNVLFICVDDLRAELGCYGNDYIKSPSLDKLAAEGMLFKRHYVNVPTCGASRYTLLTGMFPDSRSDIRNDAIKKELSEKSEEERPETFIHHMRRNGYYTVGIGKISHHPDGFLYDYEEAVSDDLELPYSWDEMLFDPGKWGTGWNAFFGYADGSNRQSMNRMVKPYEAANVDDDGYPDGLTANLAIEKLNELSSNDKPFFLAVGFFKPHLPFNSPKKYWDLYNEDELALSPTAFIPENVSPVSLHQSGEFNGYGLGEEKASLQKAVSDDYARKIRHAYYACISYTDALIGKLINELEQLKLDDNTIVVIWGDHGWHLGDHLVWGKHTVFEKALNSTLIIKVPGRKGLITDRIVSTTDIYPTILELCNIDLPYKTDGRSMLPLINDADNADWEDIAFSYYRNGISLRTDRYRFTKYIRKQEPVIELYDHLTDPYETMNIAEDNQDLVNELLKIWEKGNTGLFKE